MNKPLISVIIPAYNCEKTLDVAVDSILNQTYPNLEIIIVDDASTDDTWSVAEKIARNHTNIKLVKGDDDPRRFDKKLNRNVNAGWSARNTGFRHAAGELITFQDADDASFLNRIEIQYELLVTNNSLHTSIDWIQFDERLLGRKLDGEKYGKPKMIDRFELYGMAKRSKGFIARISTAINSIVPFHIKRWRIVNKFFFGTLENYPGPGNSPLFRREVMEKVKFRPLRKRVWPSFMGRGADRDFNFQVAETFQNSHVFFIPLYLWRVPEQNPRYKEGLDKVIM